MRFSTATLFAAFAAFALASENAFSVPDASSVITAGKAFQVTWAPTTKGDVILTLRKGPSDNLDTIGVLDTIKNTGHYEWTPEKSLVAGDDYALMISTSADDKTPNYTFQFKIDSDGKASPSASKATASATKPSSTKSTASSTVKVVPAGITSSPYTNGTTNGTILSTGYSNSTVVSKTSTKSSKTSATSLPTQSEASGAVAIVRSPIALVACLVGALFYLN